MAHAVDAPPPTPIEPVTEVLHGIEITDPYRWLEDQNSPRTRKWLEEQAEYTRKYLDGIEGCNRIRKRVEELLSVEVVSDPWKVGDRYFFLKRPPNQEQVDVMMREGDFGEDITLLASASLGDGAARYSIIAVSSDGRLLAYSVKNSGSDASSAEFFDVEKRGTLPDRLPVGTFGGVVFSPDARGFHYVHRALDEPRPHYRAVYWHSLGTAVDSDREVYFLGEDPNLRLAIVGTSSGGVLGYVVLNLQDPVRVDFYLHDWLRGDTPRQIVRRAEGRFIPFFAGNLLFAVTDLRTKELELVRIDPDRPEVHNWQTVVPESGVPLQQFAAAGAQIFVSYTEDLTNRIKAFDVNGASLGTLPCPEVGTVELLGQPSDSDSLFYRFSSFDHPPVIFRYQPRRAKHEVWARTIVPFDGGSLDVKHLSYPSKDGTLIPMFLVSRKGASEKGPLPTFLTAYGGFGHILTPQFTAYATFLMEHGCLFAVANVRGGSEFGEEWHKAGKRQNRQTVFDDFIAAAEWLISENITIPERLATGGGSNAGLLVAAAFTQRPELFRVLDHRKNWRPYSRACGRFQAGPYARARGQAQSQLRRCIIDGLKTDRACRDLAHIH